MASVDYDEALKRLLAHEGSTYTDGVHPYDPGGPTRWGITIFDARAHWKPDATADDVRTMRREVACDIYKSKYWGRMRCDALPAGVDDVIFDYAVNSGTGRSGKVARRVIGLPDDSWQVTDAVLEAVDKRDRHAVIDAICDERLAFLQGLKIWPTYKNGWTTRVRECRAFSHELAQRPLGSRVPAANATAIDSSAMAKGLVPANDAAKTAIIVGGGNAGVVAGASAWDWLAAHPWETAAGLAGGAVVIGAGLALINRHAVARQEAPAPFTVVPALAAA